MLRTVRKWLAEPRLAGVDVDGADLVEAHRRILAAKPLTRQVFLELYRACLEADRRSFTGNGLRVEIGAGSSFFKEVCPGLISTDIKPAPGLDMVVDAMAMPFALGSVRAIFGIHCFHHLPDPARFLAELERVCAPGGGCVLIEPYSGPAAAAFYRRVFDTETFDKTQREWTTPAAGPMRGANQALSYLVFERDASELARRFPGLEIVERRPLTNWARYLLSGGVNFRSLVPAWTAPAIRGFEAAAAPLSRWLALHQLIVIRRR
jgi:SAM-dependent methyltransferase